MGHLLTVPSAPNCCSINTGKWERCQTKEQCRLGYCSVNVKSLRASVPMAQLRFLSLTGKAETDDETELSNQTFKKKRKKEIFSVESLKLLFQSSLPQELRKSFFSSRMCVIYGWLKPTPLWHRSGLWAAEGQFVFGLWLQRSGDEDQKPNISWQTAPEGPWELW